MNLTNANVQNGPKWAKKAILALILWQNINQLISNFWHITRLSNLAKLCFSPAPHSTRVK